MCSKQGRYDEALVSLLSAAECDPSSPHPHSSLAAIYNALNDHDNAARHYLITTQLAPRRPNVLLNYAMFLHKHGPSLAIAYLNNNLNYKAQARTFVCTVRAQVVFDLQSTSRYDSFVIYSFSRWRNTNIS